MRRETEMAAMHELGGDRTRATKGTSAESGGFNGSYAAITQLQRTVGNQGVRRLLEPGTSVVASEQGPAEQEAERMEASFARPNHSRSMGKNPPGAISAGGESLNGTIRREMEVRLGHDLSRVRIHTDAAGAQSARALNAQAYTVGQDVVFEAGAYAPHTPSGKGLIAHELTHAVQHDRGQVGRGVIHRKVSLFENIARAFGGGNFSQLELENYLKFLNGGKIEDNFDSDNKVRALVHRNMHVGKSSKIVALLIREVLSGYVSGADDEAVVSLMKSVSSPTLRAVINYYNDNLNNRTGMGFVEDLKDALSEKQLTLANASLAKAELEKNTTETKTKITSKVAGDPNSVWVGLIVRGKWSKEHAPGVMAQHADVVIPDASGAMKTRGYFGDQPGAHGSSAGTRASTGMGIAGISAEMNWFLSDRPHYVDLELAKLTQSRSSLILIKATKEQAAKLNQSWDDLKKDPGTFYILGNNCSTAAAAGFEKAQITKEISGLDTPDHLFNQLREQYSDVYMISGFYGYTRLGRRWNISGGRPVLENPGSGPWEGPFVVERRLK